MWGGWRRWCTSSLWFLPQSSQTECFCFPCYLLRTMHFVCNVIKALGKALKLHPNSFCAARKQILTYTRCGADLCVRENGLWVFHKLVTLFEFIVQVRIILYAAEDAGLRHPAVRFKRLLWCIFSHWNHYLSSSYLMCCKTHILTNEQVH